MAPFLAYESYCRHMLTPKMVKIVTITKTTLSRNLDTRKANTKESCPSGEGWALWTARD